MFRRFSIAAVAACAMAALAPAANAQTDPVPTRFIPFDEMIVDGERDRPPSSMTVVRARAEFDRLFDANASFVDEIEADAASVSP